MQVLISYLYYYLIEIVLYSKLIKLIKVIKKSKLKLIKVINIFIIKVNAKVT